MEAKLELCKLWSFSIIDVTDLTSDAASFSSMMADIGTSPFIYYFFSLMSIGLWQLTTSAVLKGYC